VRIGVRHGDIGSVRSPLCVAHRRGDASGDRARCAEPLVSRNEHERTFLRAEKVADGLGVGLDGYGQLLSVAVLADGHDVVADVVMPDRIADFERAIGIPKLACCIRKPNYQSRHRLTTYLRRQASGIGAGSSQVTNAPRPSVRTSEMTQTDLGLTPEPKAHAL
jgi:hypothetical protein